ncbi:hypothetical protein T492DRAFT_890754 [Pavlovales sp. CCMP2436]|nr:hypothetical protein T492DRAFT_890754 [Pavlovales sp. CCMP2436]
MRAAASIGLTPISAYILRPPCAAISLTSECVSALTSPKVPMTIPRIGLTVPMEAAARIKKQLIDTIGTIAARGHAQLLLARLSALAPIAAQRGNTTNSNQ